VSDNAADVLRSCRRDSPDDCMMPFSRMPPGKA